MHTHAHHVGLHKQTPAGYAACSWLPFVCCCPAACAVVATMRSHFHASRHRRHHHHRTLPAPATTASPSPTAAAPAPATPAPVPAPSSTPASTPTSTSFPFLFPLLLLLVLFLFHFLVLLPLALFTFYRLRAVVAWWLLFPTPGVATGSGQSSPPPSPCFYLNSLPFAVQLVQFGRVIQIPQAVGGSRHTLCILTPTHCHSHSHSTSHSPSLTISSEAQHLHSSGLVFGFRVSFSSPKLLSCCTSVLCPRQLHCAALETSNGCRPPPAAATPPACYHPLLLLLLLVVLCVQYGLLLASVLARSIICVLISVC